MINRIKTAKIALRNNRGSGVVSVLIAMIFLTILGAMMLYMSYTGLLMKVTEREGTDNFYEAEAAMSIIKAEVQTMVSDTIADAYHDVMSQYSDGADAQFKAAFVASLFNYEYEYTDTSTSTSTSTATTVTSHVFPEYGVVGGTTIPSMASYYDSAVFEKIIEQAIADGNGNGGTFATLENITVSVAKDAQYTSSTGTTYPNQGTVTVAADNSQVSFNGISVTYTNPDTGYSTTVETDIVCKVPEFYTSSLGFSITTVPNFALIAQNKITTQAASTSLTINGNAYGGDLSIGALSLNGTSEDSLTITSGTLIIANDTTLANRSSLNIGSDAELWTENIILSGGRSTTTDDVTVSSLVTLEGTVYVADDMELNGDYVSVKVPADSDGKYYGFGNDWDSAEGSSAIVINGKSTSLNFDGIADLMLAGHSFINTSTAHNTSGSLDTAGVLMGESVSIKSNQLLYLAPVEVLTATNTNVTITGNPMLYTGGTAPTVNTTITSGTVVNDVAIPAGTTIKTMIYNLTGTTDTKAYYYYLSFDSTTDANQYFKDYFAAHPEKIEDYISLYTDGIQLPDDAVLSGSALEVTTNTTTLTSADGTSQTIEEVVTGLVEATEDTATLEQMKRDAEAMKTAFSQLCKTLSTTEISTTSGTTPYTYVVEEAAVADLTSTGNATSTYEFKDTSNNVVAKIVKGNYTIIDSETAKIILVLGDATVNATSYNGLIIAKENVTLGSTCTSITADESAVTNAFNAIYEATDGTEYPFYTFLNEDVVGSTDSSSKSDEYTWNLDDLVVYDDWKRS